MTSNVLWPLLRKYENGKIAGKSPVFVPPERKKMRLWGRREKEQTRRTESEIIRVIFERDFQVNSSARQVLCAHPTPYTKKNECFGGISKLSDGDEVG